MSEMPRHNPQEESEAAQAFRNAMELLRSQEAGKEAPKVPEKPTEPVLAFKEQEPMSAAAAFEQAENTAFLIRYGELVKAGKMDEAEQVLKERNEKLRGNRKE